MEIEEGPERRLHRAQQYLQPEVGLSWTVRGCFRQPKLRSPCRTVAADEDEAVQSAVPASAGQPVPGTYG